MKGDPLPSSLCTCRGGSRPNTASASSNDVTRTAPPHSGFPLAAENRREGKEGDEMIEKLKHRHTQKTYNRWNKTRAAPRGTKKAEYCWCES